MGVQLWCSVSLLRVHLFVYDGARLFDWVGVSASFVCMGPLFTSFNLKLWLLNSSLLASGVRHCLWWPRQCWWPWSIVTIWWPWWWQLFCFFTILLVLLLVRNLCLHMPRVHSHVWLLRCRHFFFSESQDFSRFLSYAVFHLGDYSCYHWGSKVGGGTFSPFINFLFCNMYVVEPFDNELWFRDIHTQIYCTVQHSHKSGQALRSTLTRSHDQQSGFGVRCDHIINSDIPEPWSTLYPHVSSHVNKC